MGPQIKSQKEKDAGDRRPTPEIGHRTRQIILYCVQCCYA